MKQILLIGLVVLTSACAHQSKKVTEVETIKEQPPVTVKIPVTTVDFAEEELLTPMQVQEEPLDESCKDEYLVFLIRYPFEGLNALKELYDSSLVLNQDMEKMIEITIRARRGDISMQSYLTQMDEINQEMTYINAATEPLLSKYRTIEETTYMLHSVCSNRLEEMLKSKKIDANQDGCELEQQKTYILDPYSFKPALNDGLMVEFQINEKLNEMYRTVYEETTNKTTLEESRLKFNQQVKDLEASGLMTKSEEAMDRIVNSFQATMNSKEQCEASSKTKGK